MTNIKKIGASFAKRAAAEGKEFINVPLKNKQTAKILWNDNSVDCFIMEYGKVVEARGAKGPVDYIASEMSVLFERLQKSVEPGTDVFKKFVRSSLSNVK